MIKVMNKETKVIKELNKEFEASLYIGTGEWELVEEQAKKEEKPAKTPILEKEEK